MADMSSSVQFLGDSDGVKVPLKNAAEEKQSMDTMVYGRRWAILLMFSFSNFMNAFMWIQFSSVAQPSAEFFHTSKTGVNVFSLVFMGAYLPGTLLSSWVMDKWGVRTGVVVGTAMGLLCAIIRWLGSLLDANAGFSHSRYVVVLVGQCVGAMAQPFFTNAPAKIAGAWFPVSERDIATVIAAMFNPLGNAAGAVVPSVVIADPNDLPNCLLGTAAVALFNTILVAVFFKDKPPKPPSQSAGSRAFLRHQSLRKLRDEDADGGVVDHSTELSSMQKLWLEGRGLLRDRNFLILLFGFSVGLGVFNALLTLIAQLVQPCGYDSSDAGLFGGVLIGAGLLGAAIAGPLMEGTRKYVELLKGGIFFCVIGATFFLSMLQTHNTAALAASFGVMGFFMLPMLPLVLENAVETIYPVPEETGAAFLLGGGQVFGIIFIFVLQALIPNHCRTVLSPSGIFLFCILMLAACCILFFKKNYKRQIAETVGGATVVGVITDDADADGDASMQQSLLP